MGQNHDRNMGKQFLDTVPLIKIESVYPSYSKMFLLDANKLFRGSLTLIEIEENGLILLSTSSPRNSRRPLHCCWSLYQPSVFYSGTRHVNPKRTMPEDALFLEKVGLYSTKQASTVQSRPLQNKVGLYSTKQASTVQYKAFILRVFSIYPKQG